ncbi:DSD1 family PLP-dependent enzyme [Tardiphaga sp.]|jgi:D-serine deaminase-like pyridoxal phosphate-dependent protein|uniref:DSD1 family PLP-dependent enzyme n=1 Tax=Tardiphaga sp. TaxID=1926292 RepID=UPI0037DA32B8
MFSSLVAPSGGIETPALVLDETALLNNIEMMAQRAAATGVRLRPHAKTHKCLEIARRQMAAGAIGISCATVDELSCLSDAGIVGLLLTSPVADPAKLPRLANIMRASRIMLVVDHIHQVTALSSLLDDASICPDLLIDIDVGQGRTGVCSISAALDIAAHITTTAMRLVGIQGFAGHVQHIHDAAERSGSARDVARQLKAYAEALRAAGHDIAHITGSGTGASEFDCDGPYTELQVGSYIFMDADYGAVRQSGGVALPFKPSLFVLATVTSINRAGSVTIDAGVKALAFNGPPPTLIIGAPAGSTYRFAGDEHGIITIPPGGAVPAVGSRVLVLTTHCDPTVNLHPRYTVFREDQSIESWPVVGRYQF